MEEFPSGQRGQTVNLLSFDFGGPNPPSSTIEKQLAIPSGLFFYMAKKREMRTTTVARRQIKQSGGLFYRSADPQIHPPPPKQKPVVYRQVFVFLAL